MNTQLVEIQPRELKFVFEVKKQSVCTVHLANLSDQIVAFKVKTTSPKKYCVRPNVGIIQPNSTCDFVVTMQAQKSAPSDMQCKDKFLIQSTVVPFGTGENDITPAMFLKDSQNYIEETKLRVVLATAPNSPEKAPNSPAKPLPSDVVLKQEASSYETVSPSPKGSFSPVNGVSKQEQSDEVIPKDKLQNGVENHPPIVTVNKEVEAIKIDKNSEEPRSLNEIDDMKSVPVRFEVFPTKKIEESKNTEDAEVVRLNQTQEFEELRSKINIMDAKLVEAQHMIEKLNKEKSIALQEKETLKQQLAMSRTRSESGNGCGVARKVHVGFPPLFVCMVALISLMLGISFRS